MSDSSIVAQRYLSLGVMHQSDASEATDLVDLVGEVVRGARQTEEDSANASNTASTVVMNVRMVLGMMGEMVRSMTEVVSRITDSEQAAARAIAQSARIAEHIAHLSLAVGNIEAVAEHTNILSLNATIEAARAGEAGRGFAVVAKEVKGLTKQTREATEHIGDQVRSIRSANLSLIESVDSVTRDFDAIQAAVTGISITAREYDSSLKAVTEFAREAAESVEEISAMLDRTAAAAHQVTEKFSHLQAPA